MLNEIKEYEQYTQDLSGEILFRLSRRKLEVPGPKEKKSADSRPPSLGGMPRALVIIARKFLFKDGLFKKDVDRFDGTVEVCKAWCGFKHNALQLTKKGEQEFEKINGWFPWYCRKLYAGRPQKDLDKVLKRLKDCEYKYKISVCNTVIREDNDENTYNSVTWERILADAAVSGPLTEWVVTADSDFSGDIRIGATNGRPRGNLLPAALCLIFAWLLACRMEAANGVGDLEQPSGKKSLNLTDIQNWYPGEKDIDAKKMTDMIVYPEGEKLFSFWEKGEYGRKAKIEVNPKFISKYHIHLIPADGVSKWKKDPKNRGHVLFIDKGFGTDFEIVRI